MPLSPGTKLGPYEILSAIGAGGMGEVYKARDTRLDRLVAIKTSKTEFSERFAREARAVAALNHPNICQLYDLGTLPEGGSYPVMEFIGGSPIAPVDSPRKLLDLAVQIADGMAAAHAAGFTHRDLKPDNILITGPQTPNPGRVKILDFGLAKYAASVPQTEATLTVAAVTNPGTVMGTVAYMSPEQARGEEVDARSDQFSFGLIVSELAAGKRAFVRPSTAETLAAIIREEAEPLPPSVPAPVRWVVERCLAKDPAERYDSTKDLYRELKLARERISEVSGSGPKPAQPQIRHPRWRAWGAAALAALVLVALGVAAGRWLTRAPEAENWSGSILGGPEFALRQRISPDGRLLAFQAVLQGRGQVAVMTPESGNWTVLTHNGLEIVNQISWSRDGASLYYDRTAGATRGIFSVPVLGGEEKLVLEDALAREVLPDGTLLVYRLNAQRNPQLFRYWPENGRLQDLPVISHSLLGGSEVPQIRATPNGREAVVCGTPLGREKESNRLLAVDVNTGASRPLTPDGAGLECDTAAVAHDGKSVIVSRSEGTLERIVSIPMEGKFAIRTLFTVSSSFWHLDVDSEGRIYLSVDDRAEEIVRYSPTGAEAGLIPGLSGLYETTEGVVSLPDGRVIVPTLGLGRIVLMALADGKNPVPLVATTEPTSPPMTAAGLRQIAFMIGRPDTIAVAETATGRITSRIAPGKGNVSSIACSPDGKTLYFSAGGKIWSVPSAGGEPGLIHAGDLVRADPSGRSLVIETVKGATARLFNFPLDGGQSMRSFPTAPHRWAGPSVV